MKKIKILIPLFAAIICTVFLTSGCNKVQELADKAEGAVSKIGNEIVNFEDNITGGLSKEAKTLDSTLNNFYSGVISGEISETNAGYLVTAPLPDSKATSSERAEAAKALTVLSAIEWQGMTSRFSSDVLSKLVFSDGKVQPAGSVSGKSISYETTLGELFS